MVSMTQAHQAVLDSFRKKREIIKEFYKKQGSKRPAVKLGGPCDWCPPFQAHELHVCLNCGRKLD